MEYKITTMFKLCVVCGDPFFKIRRFARVCLSCKDNTSMGKEIDSIYDPQV